MNNKILYAGAERADITPKIGTCLYGYEPNFKSTSVHDRLDVTALALRQADNAVILLSVTVGDFQTELAGEIRGKIAAACGIAPECVILAATHTHSAPNVAGIDGWGDIDRPYIDEILLPGCIAAAKSAVSLLAPAEMAVGTVESNIGVNRRHMKPDGSIVLGQCPWGCFDPEMTCISLRNADTKKGILNLIHYGCHGTASGMSTAVTRDWSGIMVDRLEAESGTMTAFINGAVGDVGPRLSNGKTTGNIRLMEQLGQLAAEDAIRAFNSIGEYETTELFATNGTVSIPYKKLPSLEFIKARLAEYDKSEKLTNVRALEYSYLKKVEAIYEKGIPEHDTHFRFKQTIVRLGDVMLIPFPFEFFSEISHRHRELSPARYTLCLSNTNGYNAYLPTEDQLVRGGYEVRLFEYCDAYTLVPNADQIILDENIRIINTK